MRIIKILVGGFAVIAIAAFGYLYLSGARYVVEVPEGDLKRAVEQRFPIEQRQAGVLRTSLKNPRLQLDGGTERLYMDLDVDVDLGMTTLGFGRNEHGAATISSGLRYDRQNGRLVLDGARLEALRVAELPEEYRDPVHQVVNRALASHVDGLVVYELRPASYRESLARLLLQDVEIGDGALRASFGVGT